MNQYIITNRNRILIIVVVVSSVVVSYSFFKWNWSKTPFRKIFLADPHMAILKYYYLYPPALRTKRRILGLFSPGLPKDSSMERMRYTDLNKSVTGLQEIGRQPLVERAILLIFLAKTDWVANRIRLKVLFALGKPRFYQPDLSLTNAFSDDDGRPICTMVQCRAHGWKWVAKLIQP